MAQWKVSVVSQHSASNNSSFSGSLCRWNDNFKDFGVKQKNPKLLDSSDQLNTAASITDAFLAIEDR